jgi:hypothetical protein
MGLTVSRSKNQTKKRQTSFSKRTVHFPANPLARHGQDHHHLDVKSPCIGGDLPGLFDVYLLKRKHSIAIVVWENCTTFIEHGP